MITRLVHSPMRYRPWMRSATRMLHDSSSKKILQPAAGRTLRGAGSVRSAGHCRRHPHRFHTTHGARRATDVTVSPLIGTFTGDGAIIYKQCPHSRVRRRVHRGGARRASPCAAGAAGGGGQHRTVQTDRRHIARRRGVAKPIANCIGPVDASPTAAANAMYPTFGTRHQVEIAEPNIEIYDDHLVAEVSESGSERSRRSVFADATFA